eukprot:COSAG02_NODE_33825_length_493_cov_4.571066_1_plen_63_part_10
MRCYQRVSRPLKRLVSLERKSPGGAGTRLCGCVWGGRGGGGGGGGGGGDKGAGKKKKGRGGPP